MTPLPQHPADRRLRFGAFSLLEIMVAVALLAVIIVGLLAMFYQVQRAFRAGTAQVDVMEGGRATMSLLTRDLHEVTATDLSFVTNCLTLPSQGVAPFIQTSVQDLNSGNTRGNYLQDICFLSRINDEWVGTAYRLAFADSGVGTLYRLSVRRTNDTLPEASRIIVTDLSNFVCTNQAFDGPDFHRVLDGVVHLTFTPYDRQGVSYLTYSETVPREGVSDLRIDGTADIYAFMEDNLPAYVDIELAVLEPGTFAKFNARMDDPVRARNYLSKQIGRTHVFRQRIAVKASGAAYSGLIP